VVAGRLELPLRLAGQRDDAPDDVAVLVRPTFLHQTPFVSEDPSAGFANRLPPACAPAPLRSEGHLA